MSARMIPSLGPAEHDVRSREGENYYALSKLPDYFTVIHSYKMLDVIDGNAVEQKEADFVIFNRKLGILAIWLLCPIWEIERGEDCLGQARVLSVQQSCGCVGRPWGAEGLALRRCRLPLGVRGIAVAFVRMLASPVFLTSISMRRYPFSLSQ